MPEPQTTHTAGVLALAVDQTFHSALELNLVPYLGHSWQTLEYGAPEMLQNLVLLSC